MATRIQIRRDTEANWNSIDPVLAQGELGLNLNNNKIKLGNGVDSWTELEYNPFAASIDSLTDVTITSVQNGDFLRYNGSASVWINDPVNLSTDTVGDYVQNLTAGTGVTLSNNSGEGSTPTIAIGQAVGTSSSVQFAKVTAPVTGNLTGNADTATTLQTPRTISLSGDVSGSVSFNGSANVDITATVQPNSVALGTDTTGNYVSDLTQGTGVTVTHTPGEGSSPTVAIGQDVATSASVTFAKVTAPLDGNASTASTLQTPRTIALTGDVSGSVSFNGSSDVTITATVQPNAVALGTDTTGDYVSSLVAGTGVTLTNNSGESATPTIAIGQAVGTSASVTFAHVSAPITGNVTGNVTGSSGSTTGNAATATALQNARTISLSGDVSGSVSFDGTSSVSISATVEPNSVALGTDTTGNYVNDLTAGTGVSITHTPAEGSSPTVAIGQSVATSASVTFAKVDTTGDITVGGNLTVNGTTTTLNTETLAIEDNIVVLNSNVTGSPATNAGIEVERGTSANVLIRWNETNDQWEFTNDGTTYGDIAALGTIELGTDTTGNYVNDLTAGTGVTVTHTPGEGSSPTVAIGQAVGTSASVQFAAVTAPLIGNVTGNADTATSLATSRTIELTGDVTGSVSFNGSANASISATIAANSVALGTDTTGNYMSGVSAGTGISVTHTPSEGSSATIALNATLDDLSNVLVTVPTNGDYLKFNGSNWISASLDSSGIIVSASTPSSPSEGDLWFDSTTLDTFIYYGSVWLQQNTPPSDVNELYDLVDVLIDAPTAGQALVYNGTEWENGVAQSALTLENARVISLSGDVTGSVSFNGSANASITATIAANSVSLGTDTTGNYVNDLTAGTGVTVTHTPGEGTSPTVAIGQAVGTSSSVTFAAVTAPVIGNASTASALETTRTISLTGDVSGSVSFNGSADASISATIQPNSVALGTDTTGNYVNDLTAGTGVTVIHTPGEGTSPTVAIGQAVGTSASVTFAKVDTTGDVTVGGNLTVNGTTTTLNTETLAIEDNIVILNSNVTGSPSLNSGIEVERGDSANVVLRWNESTDKWETTNDGSTYSVIATNGNIALGTDTTGNYMSDLTQGTGVTITHTPGEGSNATIAIGQAVATSSSVTFANVTSTGNVAISGRIDKTTIRESVADASVSASVVTADYATGDIFYVGTAPGSNFTVNLTNAPTDNGKAITVVIFVTQGATGYIPNAVQVAGSAQTIKWANGAAPTPTSSAGKIDIFSFTFVRRSSAWTVFGSSNLGY
jgi:hypothetical protein